MKCVGDKLCEWAVNTPDGSVANMFGRSSFNRYYYAAYLNVRSILLGINADWAHCSHKDLPVILTKTILNSAKKQARRLEQAGQLSAQEKASLLDTLRICTNDLGELLKTAYEIRCIADYRPEIQAVSVGKDIQLGSCNASAAKNWPDRAARSAGQLQAKWRELGY